MWTVSGNSTSASSFAKQCSFSSTGCHLVISLLYKLMWLTNMEYGILTCQTKWFAVIIETVLCSSEHNNFAMHSKTIKSSLNTMWQLILPQ
jgi:hypothetical protein